MAAKVRVLVLRSAGTNCDEETVYAWQLAGADAETVHIRQLSASPDMLARFQAFTIPGGFSYGDDIAAGRILAAHVQRHLFDALTAFVDAGKLVLGICNGFQVLVQAGLLPKRQPPGTLRTCSITQNERPGYLDRWVYLQAATERCAFLERGRRYEMPMAHGEGRVVFAAEAECAALSQGGQVALQYVGPAAGAPDLHGTPHNPNGSTADIAGLCDETGRVLGLMPHPERFVDWTQHPSWTSLPARPEGDGLGLFRRAAAYFG